MARRHRFLSTATCAWILVGLLLGLASSASGQQRIEEEQERARSRTGQVRETLGTASEAELLRPLEPGRSVTYADVLANPDDITLNYHYAQTLLRAGDLKGAVATLERILLLRSDLPRARLLYAVVLFRLDSIEEAELQFERVKKHDLPESLAAEIEVYLHEIELRRRPTRYAASLSFGTQWDSNRNSAPRSDEVLFLGSRFELDSASQEQSDWGFFALTQLRVEHDLGMEAGHKLLGAASYYASDQNDEDDFDLRSGSLELGGLYRTDLADFTLLLFGSHLELSSETFFKNVGLELRADRILHANLRVFSDLRLEWQDYDAVRSSQTSKERTGYRGELFVGTGLRLNPKHGLELSLGVIDKDGRGSSTPNTSGVFGYFGQEARVRHTWLLGNGQFLLNSVSFGRDSYDRADRRLTASRRRRDLELRAGITYGAPLGYLLRALPIPTALDDMVVAVSAEYLRASSNLTNYSYDNLRGALLFTKRFDF